MGQPVIVLQDNQTKKVTLFFEVPELDFGSAAFLGVRRT